MLFRSLTGAATGAKTSAIYIDSPDAVTVTLAEGTGTATDGRGFTDTLIDIDAVSGSNYTDDTLNGSSDDINDNGAGFYATFGDDNITGGVSDKDWIDYSLLDGKTDPNAPGYLFDHVNVDLSTPGANAIGLKSDGTTEIFSDTLTNVEDVYGSAKDDLIKGNNSDNWLDGKAGNDSIDGVAGSNTLVGDAGERSEERRVGKECRL